MPVHFALEGKQLLLALSLAGRIQNRPSGFGAFSEDIRIDLTYDRANIAGKAMIRIGSGNWLILRILQERLEESNGICDYALIANENIEKHHALSFLPRRLSDTELGLVFAHRDSQREEEWKECLSLYPETDFKEWSESWNSAWVSPYVAKAMEAVRVWLSTHADN